ncbi:MAG: hypothetical protein A3D92_19600 [Bacteroidetes bacterium RIFCSPHIGHO2_02_FULL_44_7]|nr:MAG: hypothetical protein A3D92_19600 [Bacteroidetes bacterium RIFCSPHIGHO2_02_FULL_44_7]
MKMKNLLALTAICVATLSFGQVERTTLVETFTSSTCPPCNPGNVALENLLANSINDGKYVSLKYQMSWPGNGDPYYTLEADTRRNFYSVTGIPQTFIDAGWGGNPSNIAQSNLNSAYAVDAKMDIQATYQVDEVNQTVTVQIDLESYFDMTPGSRLFVAIYEHETDNNVGGNGETTFEQVMKKMLPSSAGTPMQPILTGGTAHYEFTYTFNGSYILPPNATQPIDHATEHSVEEFSDLGVIVWTQTMSGAKEVYQAENATMGFPTNSLEENSVLVGSASIYPNPAADQATVVFHATQSEDVEIALYNVLGELVSFETLKSVVPGRVQHNMDLSGLPAGMYTVRIATGAESISKHLTVR